LPAPLPERSELRHESPRSRLKEARRLVIKAGTNVLCKPNGELALGRIYGLLEELVELHRQGREPIIVSSGAISLGMERLRLDERPGTLAGKQACAAIGQTRLMTVYQQAFDRFGIATAQVLLTEEDFSNRHRYLNLRNTMTRLLEWRVIPIVNENDTVSTSEIESRVDGQEVFGDNDVLSALVASKLGAELLVILSNIDGLYDRPPGGAPGARRIPVVDDVTPEVEALARGASQRGRGGMKTKLRAAKIATHSGTSVVIANGNQAGILGAILAGDDVGTVFAPRRPLSSRKRWIAFATSVAGKVHVNDGARDALIQRQASLLFPGVSKIENEFKDGDIVSILDPRGLEFARGIVNYSSADARGLLGRKGEDPPSRRDDDLKRGAAPLEFIHRDDIVILEE
jgi:glutamate 5-kinase